MNLVARGTAAGRRRGVAALLVAAVGCALILTLTGWCRPPGTTGAQEQDPSRPVDAPNADPRAAEPSALAPPPGAESPRATGAPARAASSPYALMQMNVCLSGLAGCWPDAAYPAVVEEAVARIRGARPDAVSLNEACRSDVERMARRVGYHLRFSRVIYRGSPLQCIDPGGRGLFGDALLTRSPIVASEDRPFRAQSGIEQRRWLCASTRLGVDVCTTHLNTRTTATSIATNDAQCAELGALLARRAAGGGVVFGGDVNRLGSCAPEGAWTRTDLLGEQSPGIQLAYGCRAVLLAPEVTTVPARYSNH
ncbi:MAG: endonuclease/exonuclease/phosphatase family protein, partial [Nocardioidaceae bacterium]